MQNLSSDNQGISKVISTRTRFCAFWKQWFMQALEIICSNENYTIENRKGFIDFYMHKDGFTALFKQWHAVYLQIKRKMDEDQNSKLVFDIYVF